MSAPGKMELLFWFWVARPACKKPNDVCEPAEPAKLKSTFNYSQDCQMIPEKSRKYSVTMLLRVDMNPENANIGNK